MNKSNLLFIYFVALIIPSIIGCKKASDPELPAIESKEDMVVRPTNDLLEEGQKLYKIHCLHCHGIKGDIPLEGQAMLNTSTLNLNEIIEVTHSGRNTMIGYKSILSEEELKAVATYTLQLQQ